MKRRNPLLGGLACALMLFATTAAAAERSVTLAVENMSCTSCPYIVEKSLERIDGVLNATVSFEQRTAVVRFDDEQAGIDDLTRATGAAGYPSRIAE